MNIQKRHKRIERQRMRRKLYAKADAVMGGPDWRIAFGHYGRLAGKRSDMIGRATENRARGHIRHAAALAVRHKNTRARPGQRPINRI